MLVVQVVYWGLVFRPITQLSSNKKATLIADYPAISVVICARNEAQNISERLEKILKQDYPVFEVVVVNDASDDTTATVLQRYQEKYSHLRVIAIQKKKSLGKKAALTEGIKAAQYEWLLLTDADCVPSSDRWIKTMQNSVQPTTQMVLGYGPYESEPTMVNRWVQYETIYVAIQYFSMALWGVPYMGVGRNLMYRRELFEAVGGFEQHQESLSGDDDLFVNAVANGSNTVICTAASSFMYSPAPSSWRSLYTQKKRHYSSSSYYKWYFQLVLGLLSLSHAFYYLFLWIIIGTNSWNFIILGFVFLRWLLVYNVWLKFSQRVQTVAWLPYLWVLDILLPFYYLIMANTTYNSQNKKWK